MATLFNKGKRTITYTKSTSFVKDKNGRDVEKVVTDSIGPEQRKDDVPSEAAAKLKRFYPNEIIDLSNTNDMQAQFKSKEPVSRKIADTVKHASEIAHEKKLDKERRERELLDEAKTNRAARGESDDVPEPAKNEVSSAALEIDSMDRMALLNFIEEHKLAVDVKNHKTSDALKKAVYEAYQGKE